MSIFSGFSGWSIDKYFYDYILEHFPDGCTMVELGSGRITAEFCKHYTVHSIEHNSEWVGKFHNNYIHAPIKDYGDYQWYDRDCIAKQLPKKYDFILIDGPPKKFGRGGFLHNIDLFNTNIPLLFDDTNRSTERKLMKAVAAKLDKPFKQYRHKILGGFGVINEN